MADILRLKRRAAGGAAGPPGSLAAAEIAFNEQDNTLYYGKGNSAGNATSIIAIGGPGTFAPLASPAFTGTPTSATNPLATDNSHTLATTAFVQSVVTSTGVQTYNGRSGAVVPLLTDITGVGGAPLASPIFTGDPRAPTPLLTDNDTSIATTAYVQGQGYATTASLPLASITNPLPNGTVAIGSATTRYALADHVHPTDGTRAPINNPTFTGTVTLPTGTIGVTQAGGDEDTSIATSAFVAQAALGYNQPTMPDADTSWGPANFGHHLTNVAGTLTADRTITYPSSGTQQRTLLVRNGTGGGFNVGITSGTNTLWIPPAYAGEFFVAGTTCFAMHNISLGGSFRVGDATHNAIQFNAGGTLTSVSTINTVGTGALQFGCGFNFGSTIAPGGNTDLTQHISLYGVNYGFGVTSSRLNYVSGGSHVFLAGGADKVTISTSGVAIPTGTAITIPDLPTVGTSAANKTYVDAHVQPVIATIAALRASTTATLSAAQCTVQSFTGTTNKGGGVFVYAATDTTSADNIGTIVVDASNRRWYRLGARDEAFNVMWFGAVGDGVADDAPAINAAIAALPPAGGAVEFPPYPYAIATTINVGNGSVTAQSTRNGIILRGIGGIMSPSLIDATVGVGAQFVWTGATGTPVAPTTMVLINGPVQGCGIQNILFQGNNAASIGLQLTSASFGDYTNLSFLACRSAALRLYCTASGNPTNTMNNRFHNIFVRVMDLTGASGLLLDSPGSLQGDPCMNDFENMFISLPATQLGYGIYLKLCDSNVFRDVLIIASAGGNPSTVSVVFDYTETVTGDRLFPCSNAFYSIDTRGSATAPVTSWANVGTPLEIGAANYIHGLNQANAAPIPILANLSVDAPAVAYLERLGMTTAIAATGLYTVHNTGLYSIDYCLTIFGSGTGGTIQPVFGTDMTGAGFIQNFSGAAQFANASNFTSSGRFVSHIAGGTGIAYQVVFNAVTGSPQYNLYMNITRIR